MTLTITSTVTLNNGVEMPLFGLGVYQTRQGRETQQAVRWALETGHRLIDTAAIYRNEAGVGIGIRESGISREEIFVTTKLWNTDHRYARAIGACHESLRKLQLDDVDLYLIHWPASEQRDEAWRALETLYKEGTCRAIGVSNYQIHHLEALLAQSETVPTVNQVKFNPYNYDKRLLDYCRAHHIQLEAYSPLTQGRRLDDPKLVTIAKHYDKTLAQILIRWALQHHVVVIPKSSHQERIQENADVFDFAISDEDMARLDAFS
jgi:diketogulonate reductase-like aldo/keto reductase